MHRWKIGESNKERQVEMAVSNEGTELTLAVLKSAAHCRKVPHIAAQWGKAHSEDGS